MGSYVIHQSKREVMVGAAISGVTSGNPVEQADIHVIIGKGFILGFLYGEGIT